MGIKLKHLISEKFELDLEIGDTILRGKFKNKPVVVKNFGVDDKGQPTINGKKMLSFRIKKLIPKKKSIKLKEIKEVDSLVFSNEIKQKHQKSIDSFSNGSTGLFTNFDITQFKSNPPPRNSGSKTIAELQELETVISTIDINKADDIEKYFKDFLESIGVKYPKEEVKTLLDDSRAVIYTLKYYYNRPRPEQVANALGLKFHVKPLETANTPSYPSGHSAQGRLVGNFLSSIYPQHSDEIMKISNEVSNARLFAKVHFPSDTTFGIRLGDALYNHTKKIS